MNFKVYSMGISKVMVFQGARLNLNCNSDFTSLLLLTEKCDTIGILTNLCCRGGFILPHPPLRSPKRDSVIITRSIGDKRRKKIKSYYFVGDLFQLLHKTQTEHISINYNF